MGARRNAVQKPPPGLPSQARQHRERAFGAPVRYVDGGDLRLGEGQGNQGPAADPDRSRRGEDVQHRRARRTARLAWHHPDPAWRVRDVHRPGHRPQIPRLSPRRSVLARRDRREAHGLREHAAPDVQQQARRRRERSDDKRVAARDQAPAQGQPAGRHAAPGREHMASAHAGNVHRHGHGPREQVRGALQRGHAGGRVRRAGAAARTPRIGRAHGRRSGMRRARRRPITTGSRPESSTS